MSKDRVQTILQALSAELDRQKGDDRPAAPGISNSGGDHYVSVRGNIDLIALASAVDEAIGPEAMEPAGGDAQSMAPKGSAGVGSSPKGAYQTQDEGKRPDQLTTGNDDGQG